MANPVRLTIKGAGEAGENAPTVDDLLGQVRDFVAILEGVEKAISDDKSAHIVWRVTDAERENPISFELTPYPVHPGVFIGNRAGEVERIAVEGLASMRRGVLRPKHFSDEMVQRARKIHSRVQNGLAGTTVAIDGLADFAPAVIDYDAAREVQKAQIDAQQSVTPFKSLGSIEGFVIRAEQDGYGRAIMRLRARLNNAEIKAIATGDAFRQIERMRLGEVWDGVRVRVYGTISHKSLAAIDHIDVNFLEVMGRNDLPDIDDIVDPDFTGGLTTEEYLDELRDE